MRKIYYKIFVPLLLVLTGVLVTMCKKVVKADSPESSMPVPVIQPNTSVNPQYDLGRVLFYDKNLSLNNTISCGSCHQQQYAFADNKQYSTGLYNGLTGRNSSAIINTQHNKFWDGRAGDFDTAVFLPVHSHVEMDIFDLNLLPERLSSLPYYPALFKAAYGTPDVTISRMRTAMTYFLEQFNSTQSKYDNVTNNVTVGGFISGYTLSEENGRAIFFGSGRCSDCHNGQNFTGNNTGIGYTPVTPFENIGLDLVYTDLGRGNITKNHNDDGKFLIPTLRNIELSAPYMHDGRFKTLRDVINHYSDDIKYHPNLSGAFDDIPAGGKTGINLTETEKQDLEAFLKTLTDVNFITDPHFSDPFR